MTKPNGQATWRVVDLIIRIALVVLVPITFSQDARIRDLNDRVVSMESNRFTSKDGIELRKWLHSEFTAMRETITTIKTEMPREVPPQWFIDRVGRIEQRVETLDEKFEKHVETQRK